MIRGKPWYLVGIGLALSKGTEARNLAKAVSSRLSKILTAISRRSSIILDRIVAVTFAAVLDAGQYKPSSHACTLTQFNSHYVIVAILGTAPN
jgi:hypothetical protein